MTRCCCSRSPQRSPPRRRRPTDQPFETAPLPTPPKCAPSGLPGARREPEPDESAVGGGLPHLAFGVREPPPKEDRMLIAGIIVVCVVLLVLGFLLPRTSVWPQRGVDRTLGIRSEERRVGK